MRTTIPRSGWEQASLEEVEHVELCKKDDRCIGLLFKYQNGRQAAVGQRRHGFPGFETSIVSRPVKIHYAKREAKEYWCLQISFSTLENKVSVDPLDGWHTRDMQGILFWYMDWSKDNLEFYDKQSGKLGFSDSIGV